MRDELVRYLGYNIKHTPAAGTRVATDAGFSNNWENRSLTTFQAIRSECVCLTIMASARHMDETKYVDGSPNEKQV